MLLKALSLPELFFLLVIRCVALIREEGQKLLVLSVPEDAVGELGLPHISNEEGKAA